MRISELLLTTLTAALIAGGSILLPARAAEPAKPPGPSGGHILERVKEKLGLTDEQARQIKAELTKDKDTLKNLITRLREARAGLRQAIEAPDATEASVRAASAKVAAVEADLAVERSRLHARISPILTDEQRAKVKQFQARIEDRIDSVINRIGEWLNSQ